MAYRHAIEANPQFPFMPDEDLDEALSGGRLGEAGEGGLRGGVRPAASITPSFAPALLFLQVCGAGAGCSVGCCGGCWRFAGGWSTAYWLWSCVAAEVGGAPILPNTAHSAQATLHRLSRTCDKVTFADVWRGAALSINRFVFNFIATESRFTRAGNDGATNSLGLDS